MYSLIRRELSLYFSSVSNVLMSILGALISFILYLIFLQHNLSQNFTYLKNGQEILDFWLLSGTIAVAGITTTFTGMSLLVRDLESGTIADFLVSGVSKMKIRVELDQTMPLDELVIKTATLSSDVAHIVQLIEQDTTQHRLAITTDDRTVLKRFDDIIAISVTGETLTYYTDNETLVARGALKVVLQKLDVSLFVQVSKQNVINLDWLVSLEAGFSGSMVAVMRQGIKLDVSRRYLPELKRKLGL